jgi:hypothetical protein
VLLYTVFLLVVMASTYVFLRQYEVIQAEDEGPYAGANDGTQNATDDEGAGVEPPNEDAPDSITLYNMLEDRGCSVVRGNVSEGVVLDCETGPLLDLAGNSRMVLVEQEMECEKTYDASSGSVCYRLRDTVTVSLVTGSGSYVWSREYVHVIEEWSEAVFQRYKIPVAEVQFSEAEWSGYARIEIVDSSSDKLSDPVTGPYWAVTLRIRNTGSNVAILNQVCVNDVGASAYGASKPVNGGVASESAQGLALAPGGSKSVRVFIDGDFGRLASGATVNVCLRCEGGADYIELVRLS